MTRNAQTTGRFALSHQPGVVLAYFKATEVVLWRQDRTADRYVETSLDPRRRQEPHVVWEDIDARLRNHFSNLPEAQLNTLQWANLAQGNQTTVNSWDISAALWSIGRRMLLEDLPSTIGCCLLRCVTILVFPLNVVLQPPVTGTPPGLAKALLVGGAYLVLALASVVRLLRGRFSLFQVYVPVVTTLVLLLASTPQIDPRFRVPMVPLLIFLALLPCPAHGPPTARADDQPA